MRNVKNSHPKSILVTGGAGYIGSHMVLRLASQGWHPITLDDLSNGHRDAVLAGDFYQGDLQDAGLLDRIFSKHRIYAVMHFAAKMVVGESIIDPAIYYRSNVAATMELLDAMRRHKVHYIVCSSTAATYGLPNYAPIDEKHPNHPISPYGGTKLMMEQMLADYEKAYGIRYGCLRYFNAAGADVHGRLGERHRPQTHLIPLVLDVALGVKSHINIYGTDYDTPDGSCVRDFVHVEDLCDGHLLLLEYLEGGGKRRVFNLGTGKGYSVKEVVDMCAKITQRPIKQLPMPRRAGDPSSLIADGNVAISELNWKPRYPDLETIISHAWQRRLANVKVDVT